MRKLILKLLLTLAAFWLAFHNVRWEELQAAYAGQQHLPLLAALAAVLLQSVAGGLRWYCIRSALVPEVRNPTRTVTLYYASSFFNVCFPGTIGSDVCRIMLAKHDGDGTKEAVAGVLIDRAVSLAGLLLLVASTLPALFGFLHASPLWGSVLALAVWCAALASLFAVKRLLRWLQGLRRIRFLHETVEALLAITDRQALLAVAILWAGLAHVMYATAAYALAQSLGIPLDWSSCVVLVPIVLFISTLPISLGGWGVREMGMVAILALAGVSSAPALLISIQLGLATALGGLGGGAVYLTIRKK